VDAGAALTQPDAGRSGLGITSCVTILAQIASDNALASLAIRSVYPCGLFANSANLSFNTPKAPRKPGRSQIQSASASGSDLGRLDLQELAGTYDRDRPRLHRLRNLAHEVDV
jgi:hypothetical protein